MQKIKPRKVQKYAFDKGDSIVAIGINLPMEHSVYDALKPAHKRAARPAKKAAARRR